MENGPFIVDLPIKNGGSFHSYVSLPEGIGVFLLHRYYSHFPPWNDCRMLLCKDPGESIISLSTPWIWQRSMEIALMIIIMDWLTAGGIQTWGAIPGIPEKKAHSSTGLGQQVPQEDSQGKERRKVTEGYAADGYEVPWKLPGRWGICRIPVFVPPQWHHFCGS